MFKPLPMKRVSLQMMRDDAQEASVVLAESGVFDPDAAEVPEDSLKELPAEAYREVYVRARARLDKIRARISCARIPEHGGRRAVELAELEEADRALGRVWHEISGREEELRRLQESRKTVSQLWATLQNFATLDIDLGELQEPKSFIDLHVGTVPHGSLDRLRGAVELAGYFVRPFRSTEDGDYVVVAGPKEARSQVAGLLQSADFRMLKIPAEFRDYPEKIERELVEQGKRLDQAIAEKERDMQAVGEAREQELCEACRLLATASPYAELAAKLRGQGGLVLVEGWIPAVDVPKLKTQLHDKLDRPFVMTTRDPLPAELARVPSVVRHSALLAPFMALVRNYGVPRYGEFDPTVLFAVSFVAMFGMMFGDVGHGLVVAGAGLLLRKRFPSIVPFMVAAGGSSMVFGLLYGSLFGYEHLFHPLWMSPLSDPLRMLEMALYWGIGFILLCALLRLRNLLAEHRYLEALLDSRGAAGIALYLAAVYGGFRWMGAGEFGWPELAALLVPLAAIMGYQWYEQDSPWSERALVVAIESFESVMNYLANTLSFLRVAAFSLNHVALAIAVFTLADMMGTAGHWITVVLGNLFIIVLEGAIVTIQVLRLEYYEGFSRFFSGDGREFRPLRLEDGPQSRH